VSEHLCQGDWEAKFQQGNSSLWQIWLGVSGHSFSIFSAKEDAARVRLHVEEQKQAACVRLYSPYHTCARTGGANVSTVRTGDVCRPYNKFLSWKGFFKIC
jgi:hypothetical protein